jgi:hypothetical protein
MLESHHIGVAPAHGFKKVQKLEVEFDHAMEENRTTGRV